MFCCVGARLLVAVGLLGLLLLGGYLLLFSLMLISVVYVIVGVVKTYRRNNRA